MRTIDAKAEKTGSMRLFDGSMKAKAEKASGGGSMRLVDSSMKTKARKCTSSSSFVLDIIHTHWD